jgi:hypothetical protein
MAVAQWGRGLVSVEITPKGMLCNVKGESSATLTIKIMFIEVERKGVKIPGFLHQTFLLVIKVQRDRMYTVVIRDDRSPCIHSDIVQVCLTMDRRGIPNANGHDQNHMQIELKCIFCTSYFLQMRLPMIRSIRDLGYCSEARNDLGQEPSHNDLG